MVLRSILRKKGLLVITFFLILILTLSFTITFAQTLGLKSENSKIVSIKEKITGLESNVLVIETRISNQEKEFSTLSTKDEYMILIDDINDNEDDLKDLRYLLKEQELEQLADSDEKILIYEQIREVNDQIKGNLKQIELLKTEVDSAILS